MKMLKKVWQISLWLEFWARGNVVKLHLLNN